VTDWEMFGTAFRLSEVFLLSPIVNLIDRVGRMLECVVEFLQLLTRVGCGIVLKFFHNHGSIVDVGGEFVECSGGHENSSREVRT
jgi:hypothetical protein